MFRPFVVSELRLLNENLEQFDLTVLNSLKSFKSRLEYCRRTLTFLGRGSSKIAFRLPNGHVLKLAYNRKGVAQIQVEAGDYYMNSLYCFAKVYAVSDDSMWIESEYGRRCTPSEFRKIMGFDFETMRDIIVLIARQRGRGNEMEYHTFFNKELAQQLIDTSYEDEDSVIYDLNEYVGNYGMSDMVADFMRIKNWGIVNRDGNECCVIVDSGLNNDVWDNYYRRR